MQFDADKGDRESLDIKVPGWEPLF